MWRFVTEKLSVWGRFKSSGRIDSRSTRLYS